MTDAPAPSLLDRIKAAMGTYETGALDTINGPWAVGYLDNENNSCVLIEFDRHKDALAHALDLNARAVIDAIAGALRWEDGGDCFVGSLYVGAAYWAALGVKEGCPWRAEGMFCRRDGRTIGWFSTELEARAAVEQAFKAALLPDQPKEKQA